jgi:predicted transcriptional regulator
MAVKMTFSLDEQTAARLRRTSERLRKPKSEVVRDAIRDYSERADRLSDAERDRLLEAFDRLIPNLPSRPREEVDAELEELRRARRGGGRLHPTDR